MSKATPQQLVVRARCACGQRVRVKNPRAGAIVQCPHCARSIQLTVADLRAASAGVALQPMQANIAEAPDAIPLGDELLRPARTGARPGATGGVLETPDELARDLLKVGASRAPRRAAGGYLANPETYAALPRAALLRRFAASLAAGIVLGARLSNLWMLLATIGGVLVPLAIATALDSLKPPWVVSPVVTTFAICLQLLAVAAMLRFWWATLLRAAGGEDEIPLFSSEGDSGWDVGPLLTLVLIGLVAFGPGAWMWVEYGTAVPQLYVTIALLALGSAVWPLALLSQVACSSPALLLPHLLVRTLVSLGAAYLLTWALTVVAVSAVWGGAVLRERLTFGLPLDLAIDVVLLSITIYVGHVLFGAIGLLYRWYAHRLPI